MSIIGSNILAGASGQAGYNINNSLRFRSSASAYLNRTLSTPTNNKIWTWSGWVKLGKLSTFSGLFGALNGTDRMYIAYGSSAKWQIYGTNAGTDYVEAFSTGLYRDPSAWYHLVIAVDTTQATASNRLKMYVNGTQETISFTTNMTLNANTSINKAIATVIGESSVGNDPFDGYMTEVNFIDGQQLAPSSFGETDTTTGSWKPKAYTGTYGTNGFYLKFSDIATTSGSNAGLGKDFSGNANYWTTNNISVTAGVTYDAMLDVPTNTSATVANYCVLNSASIGADATLSNANLTIAYGSSGTRNVTMGTLGLSSGKWYWECSIITASAGSPAIGITNTASASEVSNYPGFAANGWGYVSDGYKYNNGTGVAYGATFTTNDIIGIAFDADSGSITFYKNNTSQGVAFSSLAAGTYFPAFGDGGGGGTWSGAVNFGQRPFSYTPPSGFVALNTYNLPTPTILQGNKYMDATLYTGTNVSNVIVNQGQFKPDFVWVKSRSSGFSNSLYDSVRGVRNTLSSNSTNAENLESAGYSLTAFNSNGFSVGIDNVGIGSVNASAATYVGWQWQAGQGTTTAGTGTGGITSVTQSVNATAGFSIVTYTGSGTNGTVTHGLGVAPKWVIVKQRSAVRSWNVWHSALSGTQYLLLEAIDAVAADATKWNSTIPTSSVISLGTAAGTNTSAGTYVAYCWAEIAGFSKFGSYTGNSSTDGPFIYLGFRPKFVIFKDYPNAHSWIMVDSSRNTYNVGGDYLKAESSAVENGSATVVNNTAVDFLSNGFKLRNAAINSGENNGSSNYLYMAFAENPFKNSNAR